MRYRKPHVFARWFLMPKVKDGNNERRYFKHCEGLERVRIWKRRPPVTGTYDSSSLQGRYCTGLRYAFLAR